MQGGWIKLNRNIINHWVFQDAERFKWWLDLLFMAQWEDTEVIHDTHRFTLKRGQMIASISYFTERWKRNHQTIRKFFQLLEEEYMIERKILYRQTPILTICNYDKYQLQAESQMDTQDQPIVYRQVYTNKEYKEIKNNYCDTNVRVRTSEMEDEFIADMLNNQTWLEAVAMRFKIPIQEIFKHINLFALEIKCKATTHPNDAACKSHFTDWLRIQLEKQEKQNKRNGKSTKQTIGFDVTAASAKDYQGNF